ncbi:Acyl-CoA-binding protein [Seminavis robusta]|uniref:Acyl-CoA-binding protein n=1 Tax=Seminavis robusta TaxID=568900 RepID=A0A9N8H4N3_9STRA|nr:Acyl-CoA-binding protein [Seminavis robusta]|eukprot:Sro67_g037690.1 Acyl-CoA-binding protein (116) ;mRNA; r:100538-100885
MSNNVKETFDKAVRLASSPAGGGKWKLSPLQKGQLYACYKQANFGDCPGKRPGITKLLARQKYDCWKYCEGMEKEEAMKKYIEFVENLAPEFYYWTRGSVKATAIACSRSVQISF